MQEMSQNPDQETLEYVFNQTMLRIKDPEKSIDFYTKVLGMTILKKLDFPDFKFSLYFLAYLRDGDDPVPENNQDRFAYTLSQKAVLELTHNWDQKESYEKGNGWGHICIETPDVYKACKNLSAAGIKITRPPGPMKHGTRVIAFCEDPDGYKVELNEKIKNT